MIELDDGTFIAAEMIAVVKPAGDDKCVFFTAGQSALEGFTADVSALDLAAEVAWEKSEKNHKIGEDPAEDETEDEQEGEDEE